MLHVKQKRKRSELIQDTIGNARLAALPNSTLKNIARDKMTGANHKKVRIEKPINANDSYISRQAYKEFAHYTGKTAILKDVL